MKKLMLITIVGMFAVTAFAQGRPSGGPSGGPGGKPGGNPAPRVEHRDPGPRKPQGGFEWTMFGLGVTRDVLGILNPPPPPQPRVIVRESPRVIVTTPTTSVITTTPVVKEVVEVEKPVVVEKVVTKTPEIKKIEPVILGDKIYYMITFTDGTVQTIKAQ